MKNEKISYFDDEQNHLNLRSSIIDDHRFISILNDTRHVQDHLHFQISIHEFVSWIINILEAMKMMETWDIRVNDQVYSERYFLWESLGFFRGDFSLFSSPSSSSLIGKIVTFIYSWYSLDDVVPWGASVRS